MASTDWQLRASAKRHEVNSSIPPEWRLATIPPAEEVRDITGTYLHQFLSPLEIEITETLVDGILEKIHSGVWSAEAVTKAFCHRTALVHQHVNCCHELFFEAAYEDARRLDAYYAQNKSPIGPLHGLPVSLKDQFHIRGVETSMGYVGWLGTFEGKLGTGKEKVFESELVRELRTLGAVLFCKTSVPQTLMCAETTNNIIDYTYNSKNRHLSSGGSSGGEGALVSAKGSPLGFGTDIGGSVRIPAAVHGIFGLRPSTGRVPYEGAVTSMDGQITVPSVIGPLAGSVAGLRTAMQAVLSQKPWLYDPVVIDMPWRQQAHLEVMESIKHPGSLTFAVMWDDGIFTPYPPIRRALEHTVAALRKGHHQVIEWKPPSHAEGLQLAINAWSYDGNTDVREAFDLSGEPIKAQIAVGHQRTEEWTGSRIAANNVAKREFQKRYFDYWNSTATQTDNGKPVDAIICPARPYPAARPGKSCGIGCTAIWNALDCSAAVFPVTTVDKNIDKPYENFQPFNDADKSSQSDFDPELFDGAAVSLQIVGRRLEEEKILALTEYVWGAALSYK